MKRWYQFSLQSLFLFCLGASAAIYCVLDRTVDNDSPSVQVGPYITRLNLLGEPIVIRDKTWRPPPPVPDNVFIGYQASMPSTNASKDTFIGYQARQPEWAGVKAP